MHIKIIVGPQCTFWIWTHRQHLAARSNYPQYTYNERDVGIDNGVQQTEHGDVAAPNVRCSC